MYEMMYSSFTKAKEQNCIQYLFLESEKSIQMECSHNYGTIVVTLCCKRFFGCGANIKLGYNGNKALSTQADPQVKHSLEVSDKSMNPLNYDDFFGVRKLASMKHLFNARVHVGHHEGSLNENMLPYIYGSRMGHLIFDLDKTLYMLHQALNFTAHIAYRDGIILFVTQSPQNGHMIEKTALECKEFAHTRAWRQGMFTNSSMIFGAVTRLPDLVIFFNTLTTVLEEHWAVKEAAKLCIPTIGVVDTNCSPNLITYPVPGNDDSPVAIQLYCNVFKEAILKGKTERQRVIEMCSI